MKKNLRYFMRNELKEEKIVTIPGPDTIRDENGDVIQMEVKLLSHKRKREIRNRYDNLEIATDKSGSPLVANGEVVYKRERDMGKATRHMLVEMLQYPDLADPELMKFYGEVDKTNMPLAAFTEEEYNYVLRTVMTANGVNVQNPEPPEIDPKEVEDAKNK